MLYFNNCLSFFIPATLEDASNGGVSEKHFWASGFERELKAEAIYSSRHRILRAAGEENMAMAMSLDDDVPLILTLDECGGAPLAPSNGLDQEELPSRSKMVGWAGGGGRGATSGCELWAWWSNSESLYMNA